MLPHPPYLPDVATSDYQLVRSMQHSWSGENVEKVPNEGNKILFFTNTNMDSSGTQKMWAIK